MKRRCSAALLVSVLLVFGMVSFRLPIAGEEGSVVVGWRPRMYVPLVVDGDLDRVEDGLGEEVDWKVGEGNGSQLVRVVVLLNRTPSEVHFSVFERSNGSVVGGVWRHALYGFGGRIAYGLVGRFAGLCPDLLLVQKDYRYEAVMAYAAGQGRARPYVWDVMGFRGDPSSSIAVSDSGIDDSHPGHGGYGDADFSKKIVGWRDDVNGMAAPYDDNGHGSHCAGIAAGKGFYSLDGEGRAVSTWSGYLGSLKQPYIYLVTGFNVSQSGSGHKVKLEAKGNNVDTLYLYYSGFSGDPLQERVAEYSMPSSDTEYVFEYNIPEGEIGYYHMWIHGRGEAYLRVTIHWPHSVPEDGYYAWTGVANEAKLVGLKGLNSAGSGYTTDLVDGIDWAVANRETYHIMVLSMSWGGNSYDSAIDNAVSNSVASGIVCVSSAGNSGSGGNFIHSPGSNPYAISVAATSVNDNITDYSSQGGPSESVSSVVKPDITAPGGSFNYIPLLSTDSNDQDADNYYGDFYSNDSAPMQGTSMSAPFISGSAAVVAQAIGGYAGWNFSSDVMALQTKMLLLMTATETFPYLREGGGASVSPTLERGGKDVHEGYGRVNLDAAVEAATITYRLGELASEFFGASPLERKCWARNVYLSQGSEYKFNLTVPSGADYDLYLYNMTGDQYGEPLILASSTEGVEGGFETLVYTPVFSGTYYIVVKRAREDTGTGQFTLSSSPRQTVHLLLTVQPEKTVYVDGESVTFRVDVFNQFNPPLESTLTLTVTGPDGYYQLQFEPMNVDANTVKEYSFSWEVPSNNGTYVVEVGLIPARLTPYDSVWLEVG